MPTEYTSTVYVVDDDVTQRQILANMLLSTSYSVQSFSSPASFLEQCNKDWRGCIVSDILMPITNGLEMIKKIREKNISLPVIFVTGFADTKTVKTALKMGAVDFFEKPVTTVELITAINDAFEIDLALQAQQNKVNTVHQRLSLLSKREREVLDLLVSGLTNKQIANELHLSLRTVEAHRNHILKKMEANSFCGLLRLLFSVPESDSTKFR